MAKTRQVGGTRRGVHLSLGQMRMAAWLCQHESRTLSNLLGWLGVISAANHNERNGYYGGFWLQVAELPGL